MLTAVLAMTIRHWQLYWPWQERCWQLYWPWKTSTAVLTMTRKMLTAVLAMTRKTLTAVLAMTRNTLTAVLAMKDINSCIGHEKKDIDSCTGCDKDIDSHIGHDKKDIDSCIGHDKKNTDSCIGHDKQEQTQWRGFPVAAEPPLPWHRFTRAPSHPSCTVPAVGNRRSCCNENSTVAPTWTPPWPTRYLSLFLLSHQHGTHLVIHQVPVIVSLVTHTWTPPCHTPGTRHCFSCYTYMDPTLSHTRYLSLFLLSHLHGTTWYPSLFLLSLLHGHHLVTHQVPSIVFLVTYIDPNLAHTRYLSLFLFSLLHRPSLGTQQVPVIVALCPVVIVTPTWTPHCDPFPGWGSLGTEVRSPLLGNWELWSAVCLVCCPQFCFYSYFTFLAHSTSYSPKSLP